MNSSKKRSLKIFASALTVTYLMSIGLASSPISAASLSYNDLSNKRTEQEVFPNDSSYASNINLNNSDDSEDEEDDVLDSSGNTVRDELLDFVPVNETYISYLEYLEENPSEPASSVVEVNLSDAEFEDMPEANYGELAWDLDALNQERVEDGNDEFAILWDHDSLGDVLNTDGQGSVTMNFEVEEAGLYELELVYVPLEGGGTDIQRRIRIDDEVPYDEATSVSFSRTFRDANRDYKLIEANQSFPSQLETPQLTTTRVRDANGYFLEPLKFYLESGEHTISFDSVKEPMAIVELNFVPSAEIPSYDEYLSQAQADGLQIIETADIEHIQAEDARIKSSRSLYAIEDNTSPLTEPYHPTYIRMNTVGGESWNAPGQWLEWDAQVPEAGLYRIAFRYRQYYNTGSISIRKLLINGEVPFQEASELKFTYSSTWDIYELTDAEGNPLYFSFEEGVNDLRLDVNLGDFANAIYEIEDVSSSLNALAQDILVITGVSPDRFRDYQLEQRVPHVLPELTAELSRLENILDTLTTVMGGTNDKTAVVEQAIVQVREMVDTPREIAMNLPVLQNSVTALGTLNLSLKGHSLTLDYIALLGSEDDHPRSSGNLWQSIQHEVLSFAGSFYNDYNASSVGAEDVPEEDQVTVWVATGRDQMEVIRRLLSDSFPSEYQVNLRVVAPSVALSATAGGRGPDVLIQTDTAQPIDFAFRNAAVDLTQFDDFEEVADRFHPATVDGFRFDGGVYALPDQMSYPVLFYRSDILSDLNIPVPQTWDDIIDIVPFLQNNNMEFFMQVSIPNTLGAAYQATSKPIPAVYLSMLYQTGNELYNESGTRVLTDTNEALNVFEYWTDFYTKHSFPVAMDFVTRFRLGTAPLAIVNFNNYNSLSVSAPEISGDWAIAPIPGTLREDGTIDRALPATTSASMIIEPSVEDRGNHQAAWEFLKWWTSEEIQTNFSTEMESILGTSARYPVSNLASFANAPWPSDAMTVLQDSLEGLREIRQVPGSYITGRNIENAFYEVVNNAESADFRRIMLEWTENTNYELTSKREEFGLPTYEDVVSRREEEEE